MENLIWLTKKKLFYTVASCATLLEFYACLVEAAFYNKYISVCIAGDLTLLINLHYLLVYWPCDFARLTHTLSSVNLFISVGTFK